MESLFTLPGQHFQIYYDLFYELAFVASFLIYIYEGKKRKFPWIPWLLMIASVRIFFIIGSKIATYSGQEWAGFFHSFHFPPTEAKTVFGGLILAVAGLFIAKTWLRFRYRIFDAFALAIPVAMAVQRVGCLLVGCCFGNPTALPWGIHYGVFSPAYFHQVQSGVINSTATHTIGVHPIPLYIIVYSLIVAGLVWKNRNGFKAPGNLTLFSVTLLFASRFMIEFLRDPLTNGPLGTGFLGLKLIQWSLIGVVIIFVLIMVTRERKFKNKTITNPVSSPNYLVNISYIFFLSLILYVGRNWFIPIEKISILLILIPVTFALLWKLFHQLTVPGYRMASVILVIFSFIVMAQTMEVKQSADSTSGFVPKAWNSIGFGYAGGSYEDIDLGCEGNVISSTRHTYNLGRAEYKHYFSPKENQMGTIGIRGYFGQDVSEYPKVSPDYGTKFPIYGISPYFKYDFRWVGLGAGFQLGKFVYGGYESSTILPLIHLRVGPRDKLFGEINVINPSWLYTPVSEYRIGMGVNLGREFNFLHFGYARIDAGDALYLASTFMLGNNFLLEPNVSFQIGAGSGFQGGIGVHYMFGESPMKKKHRQ